MHKKPKSESYLGKFSVKLEVFMVSFWDVKSKSETFGKLCKGEDV